MGKTVLERVINMVNPEQVEETNNEMSITELQSKMSLHKVEYSQRVEDAVVALKQRRRDDVIDHLKHACNIGKEAMEDREMLVRTLIQLNESYKNLMITSGQGTTDENIKDLEDTIKQLRL